VEVTDEAIAAQVLRLIDALEDNDDVQQVHANFDVPESILARITV
jgi:transcriptional/translational regulatory protein YebC/TACO1